MEIETAENESPLAKPVQEIVRAIPQVNSCKSLGTEKSLIAPAVRRIIREKNLKAEEIGGTGKYGFIFIP